MWRKGDFLSRILKKQNEVFNTFIKAVVTHLKQNIEKWCNEKGENMLQPIVAAKQHAKLRTALNVPSHSGHGNKQKVV